MNHNYYIYMITNKSHHVIYTGVTNDLIRRCHEHQHKILAGFTSKYNLTKLVYFEHFGNINDAILREKQIKGWKRAKKDALIDILNPEWKDLSRDL
jgi:putative endonuclease